tara:strand:+ start:644 stop:769 length:126 start_codon:yes stop_codon:yes gene_type:complete
MKLQSEKLLIGAALAAAFLLSACENPWREYLPDFDQVLLAG